MQRSLTLITRLHAVALLFTIASAASAQSTARDSRWTAWIGCWQPVTRTFTQGTSSVTCIAPAGASAVEVATIDSGKVLARDTIDASGAQTPLVSEGCSGWRSGQWSPDGRRVYLRAELNCSGGIKRESSGMLAFWSSDGWTDIQTVRAGTGKTTRSTQYSIAGSWAVSAVPVEFAEVLRTGSAPGNVSRMLAGSEVQPLDVVDASKHVDATVVETWIVERDKPFEINAKMLAKLADAGVPGSITDVMIGVTYTGRFRLDHDPELRGGGGGGGGTGVGYSRSNRYDPYAEALACSQAGIVGRHVYPSAFYPCYDYTHRYDPFGHPGYYGYGSYGYYGTNYTQYYSSPVVVVDRTRTDVPHGTLVNGKGYTQGRSTGGFAGEDAGSRGSPPPATGKSSGGSTSGKSSGGSTSGSGSSTGGRTAQKRGG